MMFAENRKISIRQLQMLLLLDCFGTAVLFLPAELAEISGRGCFFAALLGGLGVSAASLLLTAVGRRMPNGTVVDWCRSVCGNGIGTILLLGLAGKLLLDGMLELRIFSEIICRFMLPATPVWVLSLVLLLVAGALAAQGTECRGRTAEILFFLVDSLASGASGGGGFYAVCARSAACLAFSFGHRGRACRDEHCI